MQSGQRSRVFVTIIVMVLHHKLHDALQLFVINNAEVWHATRPNKPARFTCLQVVQIQVMEGRDSGRRRPERGPGPATPSGGTNFPGLI